MKEQKIIKKTADFAKDFLKNAEGSHDWWHVVRVRQMAERIATKEKANQFIVAVASMLHDVADYKLHNGSDEKGLKFVEDYLKGLEISKKDLEHVLAIIAKLSFRKSLDGEGVSTLEGRIVQDADRLDAIGAIGIARTFSFGGANGRSLYDPEDKPNLNMNQLEYRVQKNHAINHFYEKILLLKDEINTNTAKEIAEHRHSFVEDYLEEFMAEWEGRK